MPVPSSSHAVTWSRRVASGLAVTVVLLTATTSTASAGSSVIVLSDNYPADQREAIEHALAQAFGQQQPGDRLTVLSARGGTRIVEVAIPDRPAYRQDRHKLPLLLRPFAEIRAALDAAVAAGAPQDGSAPTQIGLPNLVEPLRYHLRGDEPLRVLLIGTPLHDDRSRAAAFSMAGAVPEGNHVGQPLSVTVYGLAGRDGSLRGLQVHWCSTEKVWTSERHRDGVQTFWSGYLAHLGGQLATMTPDLAMCAGRFAAGTTEQAPAAPLSQPEAAPTMVPMQITLTLPASSLQADQAALLARMGQLGQQAASLRTQIEAGKVRLVEVDAFDTDDEDGDVVGIRTSGGVMVRLSLKKAPTRVVIPVEDNTLTVVGLVDGAGGGITLGLRLPTATGRGQDVHTPRLTTGQAVRIPIRIQ